MDTCPNQWALPAHLCLRLVGCTSSSSSNAYYFLLDWYSSAHRVGQVCARSTSVVDPAREREREYAFGFGGTYVCDDCI